MPDLKPLQTWTRTLYSIIHAFEMAKNLRFGRLDMLECSIKSAEDWVNPMCSYKSILLNYEKNLHRSVFFRRDPYIYFDEITEQLIKMLIQDLVSILDEYLRSIIEESKNNIPNYPYSKVEFCCSKIDDKYKWSAYGCMELIACRNTFVHANGIWNEQTIAQISSFSNTLPAVGEKLHIGFPMLFRFRSAIRTFCNRSEISLGNITVSTRRGKNRKLKSRERRARKMQPKIERKAIKKRLRDEGII